MPEQFSHYHILSSLGAGGMGEVFRARDTQLDRDVALKILPEAFASDPERLARFEREAKVLAQLNHTNIASIYSLAREGERVALALEYVEGAEFRAPTPPAPHHRTSVIFLVALVSPLSTLRKYTPDGALPPIVVPPFHSTR